MQLINRKKKISELISPLSYTFAREEMICIDSLHIRLNRFLLLIIGLWPYQQSKLVQFQFILCFSVLATFILDQVSSGKC